MTVLVTIVVIVFEGMERVGDVCRDSRRVGAVARIERAARTVVEPVAQIDGDRDVRARGVDRQWGGEQRLDARIHGAEEYERPAVERPFDANARVLELGVR